MDINALRQKLSAYMPAEQMRRIDAAYQYGKDAHSGQMRASGKPYIVHPLAVADILADWRFDGETIVAALLHDVVEDTAITLEQIKTAFGDEVARMVDGLSKIARIQEIDRVERDAENFRKLILAAAADWRVVFIKLADRLHNMRTLSALPAAAKRRAVADETLEVYAPIAVRMGLRDVQDELQNLAFRHRRPHRFRVLTKALKNSNTNNRAAMDEIERLVKEEMEKRGIPFQLEKRRKNLFSIYRKMERENLSFARVEDIIGFRLIVDGRDDCYRTLGVLHELFLPIFDRFKDFIAVPKDNGYQSLHTRVMSKSGVKVDAQIRTTAMHRVAEHGLAAHWLYKTGGEGDAPQKEGLRRLSSLVSLHGENAAPADFIEYVKIDLFPADMYVLTPKGKIVSLPRAATALDMAYAIHTEVGDHAERAIINGHSLPISMRLNSGDQVDIVTHPDITPLPHWLGYAKTARARSRIRHILHATATQESVALGKKLLAAALHKIDPGAKPDDIAEANWRALLGGNSMKTRDDLYRTLGLGEMMPDIAARTLLKKGIKQISGEGIQPLLIAGAGRSAVHFSSCCHPLPFEPLIGFLHKGRGVIIHSGECPVVRDINRRSEKWTEVQWSQDAAARLHSGALYLECRNRPGLITAVTALISKRDINIVSMHFDGGAMERESLFFEIIVEVSSLDGLNTILQDLKALSEVIRINRHFRPQS